MVDPSAVLEAIMITAFVIVLRLLVWLALAPLLPGIINKVKAWVAGRRGPPVLQLYYDLAKLWRKGVVLSTAVSPGHVAGPAVAWMAVLCAALLLPLGQGDATLAFRGDALLFVYLLALARFCLACAALETGSAFEGMGAAREVSYAVLAEAAVITALLTLGMQSGSVSLVQMLVPSAGAGAALLAAGLFLVLLAENCRVPFDDPNTHLELTMIHEVMVLDHSGPPLAVILHGAAMKLLLFAVLLSEAVLPIGELSTVAAGVTLVGAVLAVTVTVGLVESLLARYAFRRVPMLLMTAFLLCLFALLAAWKDERRAGVPPAAVAQADGATDASQVTARANVLRLGQPRAGGKDRVT
jgi:formate hydrogenlyase subunit 4